MPNPTFNTSNGALAVIIADRDAPENEMFFKTVETIFDKSHYVVYSDSSISGRDLFNEIRTKNQRKELFLPASNRIVFCTIQNFCEIDENWEKCFVQRMKELRTNAGTNYAEEHYYINIFRYQTGDAIASQKDTIERVLTDINKNTNFVQHHTEFLMYVKGFDTFDKQMIGMANLLKHICCAGWHDQNFYMPSILQKKLYILAFDEYYEQQAKYIQQRMNVIENWRNCSNIHNDYLYLEIVDFCNSILKRYKQDIAAYERSTGLYPIPVSKFQAHGVFFKKSYRLSEDFSPEIMSLKDEYTRNYFETIDMSVEKEKFCNSLEKVITYSDTKILKEQIVNGIETNTILGLVRSGIENGNEKIDDTEGKETLIYRIYDVVKNYIFQHFDNLESDKEKFDKEYRSLEYQCREANKYLDLNDCITNIRSKTKFQKPAALTPCAETEILLLNSRILKEISIHSELDNRTWSSDDLGMTEVQYISVAPLINLDLQSSSEQEISNKLQQLIN